LVCVGLPAVTGVGLWLILLQHVLQVPVDAEADPLISLLGPVDEVPLLEPVLKQVPRNFDVVTAVVGQFLHLPLFEPFQCLQSITGFLLVQCFCGKVIETQTEPETPIQIFKNVKGGESLQVFSRVRSKHRIVEALDVETDDEVRLLQVLEEGVHLILLIRKEPVFSGVENHGNRDSHEMGVLPPAHV
jgi:hypothetical protein